MNEIDEIKRLLMEMVKELKLDVFLMKIIKFVDNIVEKYGG